MKLLQAMGQFLNTAVQYIVAFNQARAAAHLSRIGKWEQAQKLIKE